MTPALTINLLRSLFVVFTTCVGILMGRSLLGSVAVGGAVGAIFGLTVVLGDRLLKGISLRVFSSATFGLLIGYIFSRLLLTSQILARASEDTQWLAGLIIYATAGYLGMMLAVRSNRDEFSLIIPYVRFRRDTVQDDPILIDGSVIIDGRLADLCASGFLSSSLIVPRFVLDELHRLAEANDPLARERGRHALERLERMKEDRHLSISIHEIEPADGLSLDGQLASLAKFLDARLLTNDSNLAAVARLQSVRVLDLHDLSRALRPVVEPGKQLELTLIKEGREAHQGVGYLNDGTMIVVNQGRAHLGKTVNVTISSSLQTSAGRLYFGELK